MSDQPQEPEIVTGYKLGLGVAARLAEVTALGIEQQQGADDLRVHLLRGLAATLRGEQALQEKQNGELLRAEVEARKARDER